MSSNNENDNEEKEVVMFGMKPRLLSQISTKYDIGDKGFLTDAEKQMRGMDSDNVGHLTNAQVSAVVTETLELRENNGRMKMWLGILGVAVVVLGLSNLGTAFAAAWMAKDTTVNESTGQLLVKDSDTPVTVQSTGLTSNLVLKESNSYGCMDAEDAAKLWTGVLDGTPSSLTIQDPSQQDPDVDPTLQAFSAMALSNNGATWNETMACMPVDGGSGDKVCVDFTDSRCDGADRTDRALEVIDHHTRRKLFHAAGHGQRGLVEEGGGGSGKFVAVVTIAGVQRIDGSFDRVVVDGLAKGVDLKTAANYAVFTAKGISTVPATAITGDIGVSVAVSSAAITGFALTLDSTNDFSTSLQITGRAYARDYTGSSTPAHLGQASLDMQAAYDDAKGRAANYTNYGEGKLGKDGVFGGADAPLTAGVYAFTTDVLINVDIYFDGDKDSIFIIQMTGGLTMAANKRVTLLHGVKAENIFWQVQGAVMVGAGSHMEGIIMAEKDVTFVTSSSLNGRILGFTICALQMATIKQPYF